MFFKLFVSVLLLSICEGTVGPLIDDADISKRAVNNDLQDYRNQILANLNKYRNHHHLPPFMFDPVLNNGAQAWAEHEMHLLAMSHSCDNCPDFSEILAKRRASRPLPKGREGGEWVYNSWFGDEDNVYSVIVDNPDVQRVGFGVAYVQDPRDRTFHMYAVGRFSRRLHPVPPRRG